MRWSLPWRSWPEFLADNPWAVDAIEWLRVAKNLWEQYNSILILMGLWLVARKLTRERERLEERVDTLGQHVKAAVDASDTAIAAAKEASDAIVTAVSASRTEYVNGAQAPHASAQPESAYANWEQVNSIWSELKERIDLRILEIPQKRVRTKYSHMRRRTYRDIISALQKDGVLDDKSLVTALLELDRKYPALRFRPKDITAEEVRLFEDVLRYVNTSGVLPPPPNGAAREPVPPPQSGGTLGNRELRPT